MTLSVIAAVARNGVIGRDNDLPWRLPADLRRFKRLTMGHSVIMGRRTFESIGRPLPGRRFVVLSRRADFRPEGVAVAASLDAALGACAGEDEVFVIGGARLFAEALPRADRLYLTRVDAEPAGDVVFPALDPAAWRLREEEAYLGDAEHAHAMVFQVYERVPRS
jgi:dihydrofolate reductase